MYNIISNPIISLPFAKVLENKLFSLGVKSEILINSNNHFVVIGKIKDLQVETIKRINKLVFTDNEINSCIMEVIK